MLGVGALPPALILLALPLMPESPRCLVTLSLSLTQTQALTLTMALILTLTLAVTLATALRRKPWAPAGAAFTNFRVDALVDARRVWIDCSEADGALSAVGVHLDADGRVFRVSAAFRIDAKDAPARAVLGPAERLVDSVVETYEATSKAVDDAAGKHEMPWKSASMESSPSRRRKSARKSPDVSSPIMSK